MADIITKEEHDFYKSQDPSNLTQEELNWVNDYEKSQVSYPSKEDLEWARFIINEKDPQYQRLNKKSGDWDKAESILKQERVAREVLQQKGNEFEVHKVKSTPEDIVKKGGYKFNWRDAYENVKGEKLRATEADAKKLQEFINSNMYGIDDDVKLKKIAYNFNMFNPKLMKWKDFINSEQGEEFKKYLEDVRNAQTEKSVEDIWEGKEPSQQWTPFGYKEVPGSMKVVDFMLPVSKEYAKNHFNDEDFSIAGPLFTDAFANLVMTGTGALPATKVMNKPLVSFLYGNVAAPAITETGNAFFNNESVPEALARTVEGTAINVGTPQILEGMLSRIGRVIPNSGNRSVQKMIDEATNKAVKIRDDINKGKPYPLLSSYNDESAPIEYAIKTPEGKKYYSTDPSKSNADWNSDGISKKRTFDSVKEMPAESVTQEEMHQMREGLPFARGKDNDSYANMLKEIQDLDVVGTQDALILKKAKALSKDGDLRSLSPQELRQLGFPDKESFMNWLIRSFKNKTPETVKTYLTNASGRPEFGREAGPIENINRLLGTSFFQKAKTGEEMKKSRIERILGM